MKEIYATPDDDLQNILDNCAQPTAIYLKSGVYKQKIEVRADDVRLIGENRETTVITYDDYARKLDEKGVEYNTFRTYTACVTGERVRLENLTVENSNTRPKEVGQCVALSVNAKTFYAENVNLISTQDTLFCAPFPDDLVVRYRDFLPERQLYMEGGSLHLFKNCKIAGTVDFIFGGAEAYFWECELISLADERKGGFVAAPSHCLGQEYGFNFVDCIFKNGGAGGNEVYLARPWRDFGKCAFIGCRLDNHIHPALFDKWNDTARDKTARFSYYNLTCLFNPEPVKWSYALTESEADKIIARCKENFKRYNI